MSYTAPKIPEPEKAPDPVINMADEQNVINKETKRKGYLSTFLNNTAKTSARSSLGQTLGKTII